MRRAFNITVGFEFYVIRGRPFPLCVTLVLRAAGGGSGTLLHALVRLPPDRRVHKPTFSTPDLAH